MNSTVSRTIISANTLLPVVTPLLATKLNFLIWSKQQTEIYDGLIEAVSQAGFHVVVLKDIQSIEAGIRLAQRNALFNNEAVSQIDHPSVNELSAAKASGKKVAVLFHEIDRFADESLRFLLYALSDKNIAHVKLDEDDVIFVTGKLAEGNTATALEERLHSNSLLTPILNRLLNYTLP